MPLTVTIPAKEYYDAKQNLFFETKEQTLTLEHSLISISLWEAKWKQPFLGPQAKTPEQTIDYIRCMTINKNVDPMVYQAIPMNVVKTIQNYIEDPMTATTFSSFGDKNENKSKKNKITTSEELYYDMAALGIPFECEKWHLNRLITLLKIGSIKNQPPKKMSKREIMSRNKALNESRRRAMHTTG